MPRDRDRSPPRRDRSRSRSRERDTRRRSRSPVRRDDDRSRHPRSRSRERRKDKHRSRSRSRSRDRDRKKTSRRSRSRSRSPHDRDGQRKKKRRRSRSASSSSSSDDDRRRRRKRSRSRSRSKERKDKKRKHKKDKKKKSSVISEWGKYGTISEADLYTKDEEFRAWLLEEQKINPETVSKDQTRKQFAKFVEDFNTGTLPHEKYYNLSRYEARMALVRSGEALPPEDAGYDFSADIAAHTSTIKRGVAQKEATYSRAEVEELRRVQNERVQLSKMKVLGMDIKTSMGVRMTDTDTFGEE
ncbi:hypothetical protein EXIGLDRAFT_729608 [Exidia glandulosa HHB12029]|uniref:Uncharacterized protein n=1 Tax=Exidia glandulosa HHB12029 TaxID=1314781 RepID=A0A166B4H1_EXIGL|nr:hypothetical protein EXIGLDRAFT_729608 [Exidia glandulosa HHB12029]